MTRDHRPVLFILLTIFLGLLPGVELRAQEEGEEEEGPASIVLQEAPAEEAPRMDAIQNRFFYKGHRLELFPHVYAGALNNSFARRFLFMSGVGVAYHLSENLFVEGVFDYFPNFPNDLKPLTLAVAETKEPGDFIPDVRKERAYAGVALGLSPIYGKINLVSSHVQNFDVSFLLGVGVQQIRIDRYQVATDPLTGAVTLNAPTETINRAYPALSPGLTTRFFVSRGLTLRADARSHLYVDKVEDYYQQPNSLGEYPLKPLLRMSFILSAGISGFLPGSR